MLAGAPLAGAQEAAVLDSVVITADQERADGPVQGYRAKRTRSATRTDTPIEEIPQSISVVPASVLDDLDSPRVERALDFAGGVARQNDFGGLTMYEYSVRGLTTSEFYKDGFSVNRGYMNPPDAASIERVEVLKGPSASLYGRGDPGGTINIVSKRPQLDSFARLDLSSGRWDRYRSALDVNTPLGEDGNMLYRMNIAVEDNKSFRDHRESERQFVAPSFSWELSPDTRLLVQAEVVRNRQTFDRGVVAPGGNLGRVSRSAFYGEPSDGPISNNNETLQAELEHDLNEVWTLRLASHYKQGRMDGYATEAAAVAADGRTLSRNLRYRDYDWQDAITQRTARPGGHRFDRTSAADRHRVRTLCLERIHAAFRQPAQYRPLQPRLWLTATGVQSGPHGRSQRVGAQPRTESAGPDASDRQALRRGRGPLRPLRTAPGQRGERPASRADARKDHASGRRALPAVAGGRLVRQRFAVVQTEQRAAASGATFDPEEGMGYEAGVKLDLFDGRLGLTAAAFHLTKENVLTSDPANDGFQIAAGEVRSRGVDLQLAGQLTDAIRVIGAYAYVDAEVTRDNTLARGSRLLNVPRHSGSLLTTYEFQDGDLRGLSWAVR